MEPVTKRFGRGCKPRPAQSITNVSDGVANPVQHSFEINTSLTNSHLFEEMLSDKKNFSTNFIASCQIDNDFSRTGFATPSETF